MKRETQTLPSGKQVMRTFEEDGTIASETHSYGNLEIACEQTFTAGKIVAESYFVKRRMAGRARYEKARAQYPDMPESDSTLPDSGAEWIRLAGLERKQKAAANKRRRENPPTDEQQCEAKRQIPFFQAAGGQDIEALRRFLDAGEDPNGIHVGGRFTPLYNACFAGAVAPDQSLAAVRLLLERGADPNKRFEYDSPIDGRLERGLTALMFATTAEIATTLLDAGAEVNVADERGMTPLMRAAFAGRVGVVKVLLARNADVTVRAANGCNAADFARSKLEFFTENIPVPRPAPAEGRVQVYQEIVRLVDERR